MVTEEHEVTEIRTVSKCDVCGVYSPHRCYFCKKDLCGWMQNKHAIIDPYDCGGDYPNYYCEDCIKIGEPFMKIINECQKKENKSFEKWENICKTSQSVHFKSQEDEDGRN